MTVRARNARDQMFILSSAGGGRHHEGPAAMTYMAMPIAPAPPA
jgi:hypothetical protein